MTITLDLSPEVSDRARAQAARQQVPLQDYLARIVADAVSETDVAPSDSLDPAQAARRERSLALLSTLDQIGDDKEQQETFAYLQTAVNADRLSDRDRF